MKAVINYVEKKEIIEPVEYFLFDYKMENIAMFLLDNSDDVAHIIFQYILDNKLYGIFFMYCPWKCSSKVLQNREEWG